MAAQKTSPMDNLQWCISMACGHGGDFLRDLWRTVTGNGQSLARLGLPAQPDVRAVDVSPNTRAGEPGVEVASIPRRIMSFLLHVFTMRFWAQAFHSACFPKAFASLLHTDPATAAAHGRRCKFLWEMMCDVESILELRPGIAMLYHAVHWWRWPLNQYTFRLLAHHDFDPSAGPVRAHLQRCFLRLGDSRVIEEAFKATSDRERLDQSADVLSPLRAFHALATTSSDKHPLRKRGADTLGVTADDWQAATKEQMKPPVPWRQVWGRERTPLEKHWHCERVLGGGEKPCQTKTPASSNQSIVAFAAMEVLWTSRRLGLAGHSWQTVVATNHSIRRVELGSRDSSPGLCSHDLAESRPGLCSHDLAGSSPGLCKHDLAAGTGAGGTYHLVLAVHTYAARVWKLIPSGSQLLVNPGQPWMWVTVTDA